MQFVRGEAPLSSTVSHARSQEGTGERDMSDRPHAAPTHAIWHIRDREGKKAFWTEIGVGFTNRDGSITLKLNLVPLDGGMIQVKPIEPRDRSFDRDDDYRR